MQKFLENWMLPLAISLGAAAYLVLYNVPYLKMSSLECRLLRRMCSRC